MLNPIKLTSLNLPKKIWFVKNLTDSSTMVCTTRAQARLVRQEIKNTNPDAKTVITYTDVNSTVSDKT